MQQRKLGTHGPVVGALGLGCMGMSDFYGPADDVESVRTIHAALDAGMNLLDTGDFYGMGHNEMLLRDALKGRPRDSYVLSVKYGAQRTPTGEFIGFATDPRSTKTALAYSLKRLGVDHVDIYRPSRVAPGIPIEDTIGAIADLVQAGYVRHVGLSEAGVETVRRAHAVYPIVDLQIEYGLASRKPELEIIPALRELGIGLTAYGVLSRGLVSDGALTGESIKSRGHFPRFQGDNLSRNLDAVSRLAALAAATGATTAQLAIAWALSRGDDIAPLVGARRLVRLDEALGALNLDLSHADLADIEAALPPGAIAGDRYAAEQMRMLDSER